MQLAECGDSADFCRRTDAQFAHQRGPVTIDGPASDSHVPADDRIGLPRGQQIKHLALARREERQPRKDCVPLHLLPHFLGILREALLDTIQQDLVIEWLFEKVDRSSLHGANRCRDIGVSRDDDHWNGHFLCLQNLQGLDSSYLGHPNIEHQARRSIRIIGTVEILEGGERLHIQVDRFDEQPN